MTLPAITTLRQTIATALSNPTQWQTFAYPPATILANSVIVVPDDPYLVPTNDSFGTVGPLASFRILMTIPALDNQGNLQGIESMVTTVFTMLCNSSLSFSVTQVAAPSILSAASGDLLSTDLSITLVTSWS